MKPADFLLILLIIHTHYQQVYRQLSVPVDTAFPAVLNISTVPITNTTKNIMKKR